jgi:hypothetical protein
VRLLLHIDLLLQRSALEVVAEAKPYLRAVVTNLIATSHQLKIHVT